MVDTIDPNIPLQAGRNLPTFGPDLSKIMQMRELQMRMQAQQQQVQQENQLKALFAQPGAMQNGALGPNTAAQAAAIDPDAGIKLMQLQATQGNAAITRAKALQDLQEKQRENQEKAQVMVADALDIGLKNYNDVAEKMPGSNQAMQTGGDQWRETVNGVRDKLKAQGYTQDQIDRMVPGGLTPSQAKTFVDMNTTRAQAQAAQDKLQQGWSYETDEGKSPPVQYMRKGTTTVQMDGKTPYTPTGVGASKTAKDLYTGTTPDGKTVTVQLLPTGGFADVDSGEQVKGLTNIGKIGPQANAAAKLSPDAIGQIADQYLAGDKGALQGLGYGSAGAANRAAVRDELARRGVSGKDIAAAIAEFSGTVAGERTAAVRSANLGMALNEAKVFIPMGVEASEKVSRTSFPTLNSVIQAYDKGTGDEDIIRLSVATNAIENAYAQVAARGGQSTDAARARAHEILNTAFSKGQYKTAADQLMKEITAAGTAPAAVRQELREGITGEPPKPGGPQPSQAAPVGPSGKPIPQGAIDMLKKDPKTSAQFDEIFGSGAAAKVLGGQ
jgi:hypothetical protein